MRKRAPGAGRKRTIEQPVYYNIRVEQSLKQFLVAQGPEKVRALLSGWMEKAKHE